MAKKTYAIMGATGHIGMVIAETLLKKGHKVRAIGRDEEKLSALEVKGAETIVGSFDNLSLLNKAFAGADAVFSFLPPGILHEDLDLGQFQDKIGEAIKQALTKSNIKYVLNLSSVGANLTSDTGPVKGLARHEKRLNALPNLNVLHLRPEFFMENLLWSIPLIQSSNIIGMPLRPDVSMAMIATKDIGLKAAELLDALSFSGQSVMDLVGPREVTLQEATQIIGKAIAHPDLKYVQFSESEAEKRMMSMGMKPKNIKLMLEMYKAYNEGKIKPTQRLTAENRCKTTLEAFAKSVFAPAIMAAAHS
jgi:uncharacterized protein YbjT (DUF2867 family)